MRTLRISIINWKTNLSSTWLAAWVITDSTGGRMSAITDAKLYVPVATSSVQDNEKLLQELELCFKKQLAEVDINQK